MPATRHANERRFTPLLNHHLICMIGLMGCLYAFGNILALHWARAFNLTLPYTYWALNCLAESKPGEIAGYLSSAGGMFLYVACIALLIKTHPPESPSFCKKAFYFPALLVFNLIVLGLFLMCKTPFTWAITTFSLLLVLLAPWYTSITFALPVVAHFRKTLLLLITGCFILVVIAISPYLALSHLKISSDFLWAPETTLLESGPVDNSSYIMEHGIGSLFDIRLIPPGKDFNLAKYNHVPLSSCPDSLQKYLEIEPQKYIYYCTKIHPALITKSKQDLESRLLNFCRILSPADCQAIVTFPNNFYSYSKSELEFINKNTYELSNNVLAGHYFYHHYSFLGPLNELFLHKDTKKINFLYGFGSTRLMGYLLNLTGKPLLFENYIAALYVFFPIYFLLMIACSFIIFQKDLVWLAISTSACTALFFLNGFEAIRLAPGFNPLRHLPDLLLILFFYFYLTGKHAQKWLILAFVTAILAILHNTQFGTMMFAALFVTSVIHTIGKKNYRHTLSILLGGFAAFIGTLLLISSHTGKSPDSIYMLLGVSVAPGNYFYIASLLFIILFAYTAIFFIAGKKGYDYPPLFLCIFLLIYTQCLWIYYIWYSEPGHLLATSPIWVLFCVVLLREIFGCSFPRKMCNLFYFFALSSICIVMLFSVINYFISAYQYNKIFKTHVVYKWDFPSAHFLSTMNPFAFKQASDMIRMFSEDSRIFMISRYDSLLPFLAEKYNAFPSLLLATSLVTKNEIRQAADFILSSHPEFLFVDSDIRDSHAGDVIDDADPLKMMVDKSWNSYGRVAVLSELQNVFLSVADHYHLVKKGFLIDVYKRNTASE